MKQRLPLLIGAGAIVVIVWVVAMRGQPRQQPQQETTPNPESAQVQVSGPGQVSGPAQATPAPAGGEQIVYTFADEAKLREFANLWQDRQNMALRMSVLQAYWNSEQAALAQLNEKLASDYAVDPAKDYSLNAQERVLLEQPAPPGPEPSGEQAKAQEGTAVHTFADEEAMRTFATLWQQRQGVAVRMRVLESYWKTDQANLGEFNSKLAADYSLDPTKNYFLDGQRRVIVEVEAPPAAEVPAADQPAAPALATTVPAPVAGSEEPPPSTP